ncbi:MAG: sulfatase-like hydrolase/transferase [Planctomycetota bacterium]|nr:sulfatase-like hydrolase/transferase [Planctomycetota bacterium]
MPKSGLNVIVICNDTLRADVVDHTWEDRVDLPNLDRLREQAFSFTRAYGDGYPTVPSRRGFYTGRRAYPWNHDIDDRGSVPNLVGWHAIPSEYTTLAETLSAQGRMTGLVADLYHMFKPTMNFSRGYCSYDYIRGQETDRVRSGPISRVDLKRHLHPGEKDFKRHGGLVQYLLNTLDRKSEEDYFCPRVMRSAARWIDDNASQGPFLLWIDSFTPHEFWDPPKAFADRYFKKDGLIDYAYPQFFQDRFKFTEDEDRRTKALYYGYCTFMDKWIGRLFSKLDEHKLWDETVVIVTSDHGTELRDKGRFGKGGARLYDYNSRLNLIVRHPEQSTQGKSSDAFAMNIDLAPTICKWMGVDSQEPYDGKDLMPVLSGQKDRVRDHVIGAWSQHAFVRQDDWHYLVDTYDPSKQTELYDLKSDPKCNENLAASRKEIAKELRGKLEAFLGAPLPASYKHQARGGRAPGLGNYVQNWKESNLGG